METLRDHITQISREIDIRDALSSLHRFCFDSTKSRRMISGIAVSSLAAIANDDVLVAQGAKFSLPVPLLWNHDWTRPLGRVLGIEVRGDQIRFRAEVGNAMPWIDQIWREIIARNAEMVSVEAIRLDPIIDSTFTHWHLSELSVLEIGADAGAVIQRCWERLPYVSLTKPNETVHWSSL